MRQILIFIFLSLLAFSGRTQSSSMDSLRMVLPEGHDLKSFITNIHRVRESNYFISVGSDGTSFLFDIHSQKRLEKYDLDKYASISDSGEKYISLYKDYNAKMYSLKNELIYDFKIDRGILSGFVEDDNFGIVVSKNGEILKLNLQDLDIDRINLSKKISYATWNTSKTHLVAYDIDNNLTVINARDFSIEQELKIKETNKSYFVLADFDDKAGALIIFMNNEIIINPNNINERKYSITGDAPIARICNNFFQDIFFTDDDGGLYHLSVTNDTLIKIYEHKSLITALINSNDKSLLAGSFDGDVFQINTNSYSIKKIQNFVPIDRNIQINEFDLFSNATNILPNEIIKLSINQYPPKKLFSKSFFQEKKKVYLLSDSIHPEFMDENDLDRNDFLKLKNKKEIWSVFQLSKSEFFVSTFSRFQYYDFKNNLFREVKTKNDGGIIESLQYRSKLGHVLILTWGEGLLLYDINSHQLNDLCNEANCFSVSQNFEEIVVGGWNGYLYFLDNKKYSVRDSIQLKGSTEYGGGAHLRNKEINSITFLNERILLIDLKNDEYLILDLESRLSLKIFKLVNNNWLIKLPNSPYYMCSKGASKMLHYVTPSLKVIGFDQLDPVYNRPDIVLDSIGKYFDGADRGMIDLYQKAWEKRIDRLGLDKEKLGKGEISVPNAEFVGAEDIAYENTSGRLELKVEAKDPKYTLRRFNILVNEVPLYGSEGISIASRGSREWNTTVSIPLSVGENKIQVSVMNELGLENFKYPTYVNYTPKEEIASKTYFIGIGVDEFKEDGHDLSYCVKDIEDLSNAFKSSNNTKSIVLTNEQVTKENILALKSTLKNTSVHDKVIISCSSHGLLDDENRFYLATHDVDFSHPENKGLPYAELEGLLDSIPARQKLLMLDACNSGENEIEQSKRPIAKTIDTDNENQGKPRGEILVEAQEEFQSSFETMMELFVNVSNETGSVIISAAGGKQSALEGEAVKIDGKKIENGAFTYSVLEYLKQTDETLTVNGLKRTLTVNGLKSYVEKRVEEITNGKQRPTSRQETMEVDWDLR